MWPEAANLVANHLCPESVKWADCMYPLLWAATCDQCWPLICAQQTPVPGIPQTFTLHSITWFYKCFVLFEVVCWDWWVKAWPVHPLELAWVSKYIGFTCILDQHEPTPSEGGCSTGIQYVGLIWGAAADRMVSLKSPTCAVSAQWASVCTGHIRSSNNWKTTLLDGSLGLEQASLFTYSSGLISQLHPTTDPTRTM